MSPGVASTALLQGFLSQSRAAAAAPVQLAAEVIVIGLGAAVAAGLVALAYRWYVRERVPTGLAVLFGLSVVAVSLVPTGALGPVIRGDEAVLGSEYVLRNLAAFALGAAGSSVGIRVGDAVGTDFFAATGGIKVDRDVSDVVQTVGRVTSVKLPEDIDDIVGYDPMPEETKEALAGRHFLFPRRLTKADLRDRLVSRLKTDYGVGHIDLELNDDGTVEYLAIGSRAAGIGPTLPPATNAVAIRADPAHAASAGDLVQVWESDPLKRVLTGELRGIAGDIVTVAIDAGDTPKLDPATEYKLVTLPVQDRPDREFASLLRAAEETMGTVTVPENSELVGTQIGTLGVTVAAITREGSAPEPIPARERALAAGDVIYAIGKPDALRQVETAANRQRAPEVTSEPADEGTGEPSAGETAADAGADTNGVTDADVDTDGVTDADADTAADAEADPESDAATDDEPAADHVEIPDAEEAETADGSDATSPDEDAEAAPDDTPGNGTEAEDAQSEGTAAEDEPTADASEVSPVPDSEPGESASETADVEGSPETADESVTVWDPEERLDRDDTADETDGPSDDATAESSGEATDDEPPDDTATDGERET
jgi:hypothetical protein